jgi:hypothetical protein
MRQIATLMPAEKAECFFLIRKRTERFFLPLNKLAQIFALGPRWPGHERSIAKSGEANQRNPEQLIAGSIGAPASGTARHCSLHHHAVPEAGAPIHAFATNCRNI